MWRPLGPTSRATSSASMACSTCRPVPTARASRPSRAAPASSATATLTCSGSWSLAWSVLVVGWVSFGTAVPFWSSVLADARHLPHGRSQAGTATSTSTGTGTTSGAHLLGTEPHEATLLGGVSGRLGRGHQPPAERLGLLGSGLGRHQLVDAPQLLQHLLAAARPEVPQWVLPLLGQRLHVQGHRRQQLLLARRKRGRPQGRHRLFGDLDRPAWVGERDRDTGDQGRAADPGPFLVGEVLLGCHGYLLSGGRQPKRGGSFHASPGPIRPPPGRTGSGQAPASQLRLRQPWSRRCPWPPSWWWFEHAGCWGPHAGDQGQPSTQGDVPGPDPARAPPNKAIAPAGLACRGQPAGGLPLAAAHDQHAAPPRKGGPGLVVDAREHPGVDSVILGGGGSPAPGRPGGACGRSGRLRRGRPAARWSTRLPACDHPASSVGQGPIGSGG